MQITEQIKNSSAESGALDDLEVIGGYKVVKDISELETLKNNELDGLHTLKNGCVVYVAEGDGKGLYRWTVTGTGTSQKYEFVKDELTIKETSKSSETDGNGNVVDTYTIKFSDGSSFSFSVTNGKDGTGTDFTGTLDDSKIVGGYKVVEMYADMQKLLNTEVLKNGCAVYVNETDTLYKYNESQNNFVVSSQSPINLENGVGIDSVVQKYSGDVDESHYGNTSTGESAAVFGEANENDGNRTLMSGKLNKNKIDKNQNGDGTGAQNIIGGLKNEVTNTNNVIVEGSNNKVLNADNSIIAGFGHTVENAEQSATFGAGCKTSANYIFNSGYDCEATKTYGITIGAQCKSYAVNGVAIGANAKVNTVANYSVAIGAGVEVYSSQQVALGAYNERNDNAALMVGNGTGTGGTPRKNAFTVLKDGRAKVQSAPIEAYDVVRRTDLADPKINIGCTPLYRHNILLRQKTPYSELGKGFEIFLTIISPNKGVYEYDDLVTFTQRNEVIADSGSYGLGAHGLYMEKGTSDNPHGWGEDGHNLYIVNSVGFNTYDLHIRAMNVSIPDLQIISFDKAEVEIFDTVILTQGATGG